MLGTGAPRSLEHELEKWERAMGELSWDCQQAFQPACRFGGLTWNIALPSGYHTKIDPSDGKRRRLWEPLEYKDQVILQSRSSPFEVSVEDDSNNVLDFSFGLDLDFARKANLQLVEIDGSVKEKDQNMVEDMLDSLQLQQSDENVKSSSSSKETQKSPIISNACFQAIQTAETLADVLDAIHGLAKLYNLQLHPPPMLSKGPTCTVGSGAATDSSRGNKGPLGGELSDLDEDEDDDHLFASEIAIKWSWIATQVGYASAACQASDRAFRASAHHPQGSSGELVNSQIIQKGGEGNLQPLNVSRNGPTNSDSSEEETYALLSGPSVTPYRKRNPSVPGFNARDDVNTAAYEFKDLLYNSDSDAASDCSWEMGSFTDDPVFEPLTEPEIIEDELYLDKGSKEGSDHLPSMAQEHNRNFQNIYSTVYQPPGLSRRSSFTEAILSGPVASWQSEWGPSHCQSRAGPVSESRNLRELQWCDISFNPKSFSVECTVRLDEIMDNHIAVTALGFALGHPLLVEIVPNKVEVDSLSWNGAVDVFVSQQSDWHNHVSEEICGLLCWVPYIVKNYFETQVPNVLHEQHTKQEAKGELFMGVLRTLVRRLVDANTGGSCIVCTKPGNSPSYLYMRDRYVWACSDVSMCQATFSAWQEVSSLDPVERAREENSSLRLMEETLRNDFSYDGRELLRSALGVYNVNTDNMNYGQMIRALARIELWNQKDPNTFASESLFQ